MHIDYKIRYVYIHQEYNRKREESVERPALHVEYVCGKSRLECQLFYDHFQMPYGIQASTNKYMEITSVPSASLSTDISYVQYWVLDTLLSYTPGIHQMSDE